MHKHPTLVPEFITGARDKVGLKACIVHLIYMPYLPRGTYIKHFLEVASQVSSLAHIAFETVLVLYYHLR